MPSPSSQGSADSTADSPVLGFDICSSVRAILGGGTCSEPGSLVSPFTTTYETFAWQQGAVKEGNQDSLNLFRDVSLPLSTSRVPALLTSFAEAPPAKTSQSPGNEPDSTENDPACSSSSPAALSLFDPDGFSGRTYSVRSLQTAVGTSEQSLERWPTSGMAWPGGFSTHVSSECRSDAGGCSSSDPSLSEILQPPLSVPARYSLSGRAARGILRRAAKRGRTLPTHLQEALEKVAQTTTTPNPDI